MSEAHEAIERFEQHGIHGQSGGLARHAAVTVAILAALLAMASFLSNEAVKEVITGETKAADQTARLEANAVKTIVAEANSTLLRVVGNAGGKEERAARHAMRLERRIEQEFAPIDRRLEEEIRTDERDRDRADERHLLYELATVGLQIGIVLATISIIARRRWLLAGGQLLGACGAGVLVAGLVY